MKNIAFIIALVVASQLNYSCRKSVGSINVSKTIDKLKTTEQVRFIGHWMGEGKREKLVSDFVRQYSFRNQHVDILMKFPEEVYYERSVINSNERFIVDMIQMENPEWDIIRINDQYESVLGICEDSLWAKKNLVDFSEIPEFVNNTRPEILTEEFKARWGGMVPGPFIEGQYWALWSNAKVAEKVGIKIKQHGMTGDDLISYVKAVDQYNKSNPDDYITPIFESSDWPTTFWIAYQLFISEINDYDFVLNPDVNELKLQAWHKALSVLEELSKYNAFNANWKKKSWADTKYELINEKCLFYSNGSWMYNIWEAEDAQKTMNCYPNEYPVFKNTTHYPFGYIIMWGVLKNSPNRDAAVDMLLAMNTPDIADRWVQYTKCPTGIVGNVSDVLFGVDQFESFTNFLQANYEDRTFRADETISYKNIGGVNLEEGYTAEVITGQLTADEAMELIRKQAYQ